MSSLYQTALHLLDVIAVVAFVAVLLITRLTGYRFEIRGVGVFFAVWAAVFLVEYWVLGPYSHVSMDEEGDMMVSHYRYLNEYFLGGQFGHELGSGADATIYSSGSQLFSPERFFLAAFPVWIAILLHKFIVLAVGFFGSYLLCRESVDASPTMSALAAAIFTVSSEHVIHVTYGMGGGLSFVPLLLYAIVCCSNRLHYYPLVILSTVGFSLFIVPTNNALQAYVALALGVVLFNKFNYRIVASTVILTLAILVNWAEVFYGMAVTAPYTERGGEIVLTPFSVAKILDSLKFALSALSGDRIHFFAFVPLLVLWFANDPLRWRATLALLGPTACYVFFDTFPWETVGFAAFKKVSHQSVLYVEMVLMLPILARAAMLLPMQRRSETSERRGTAAPILLAVAIAMMVYFKSYNVMNLLYHGGQSQYHTVATATDRSWRADTPFRVITLRAPDVGPEPELAAGFYGLDAFDYYFFLKPKQHTVFWREGILGGKVGQNLFADWSKWVDGRFRIGEQVSLDLLRVANIGAFLSPVPMEGKGVRRVAGPTAPPLTRTEIRSRPWDYAKERIRRLFDFNDPYIYALDRPFPRAYAAARIVSVGDGITDKAYLELLERHAAGDDWTVLVRFHDLTALGDAKPSLRVTGIDKVRDGYTVTVSAADGGVVVLNTPQIPFWSVTVDGNPGQALVAANFIHMAVRVPPGAERLEFRYHRPTLIETVRRMLN